jgi:iron complex outermembrane receptor protein
MRFAVRLVLSVVLTAFVSSAEGAQAAAVPSGEQGGSQQQQQQQQEKQKQQQQQKPEQPPKYEDLVVVSASKVEEKLVNAPATMSVIGPQQLQAAASQNYGDLLRAVPGMNVTMLSARDVNLTSRAATGTLSTSQLALLDGRTLYQDFFGFVMWDFLPVNLNEIKQIEVIRGPASAVWGANALTGVVNVITKSPREMQGTTFVAGLGTFDRDVGVRGEGAGSLFYISGTHAAAVDDRWAYKVSAGAYTQEPLPRPAGTLNNSFNTPFPPYDNQGTTQPKFDVRADYDFPSGGRKLVLAGGLAATEGIIHTGLGPFDIHQGSVLGYLKANYSKGALKANFFVNILNGDAQNLLSRGVDGQLLLFDFKNQTYDFEYGNAAVLGGRHVLSYGGNVRHNGFDLSIAPRGDSRNEGGVYVQDDMFLSDHFRLVLGGRLDRFDVLDHVVFSPRTALLIKPHASHTLRVSYNRAYRAPSLINNYLEATILNQLDLGALNPLLAGQVFTFPILIAGNENLEEESMNAYEVSYTGVLGSRATVTAAFYVNDTKNSIFFTQNGSYRAANPPPNWPLPPLALELIFLSGRFGPGNGLPASFTYLNFGKVRQKGVELGIDAAANEFVNVYANYAYQAEPVPTGFDISELNLPAKNRFNAGVSFTRDRWLGNLSLSYSDSAFWQDVLDARFHGATDSYTIVNGGVGYRWNGDRLVTSLKVTNLANQEIQQHVFGDVFKRQIVGEVRLGF